MKLFFIAVGFFSITHSMDYDQHIKKCVERAKKDPEFLEELKAPVLVDCNDNQYVLTTSGAHDENFYRYKNMLKEKIENEERLKKQKEVQRMDLFYQRISILCIILGHISGVW